MGINIENETFGVEIEMIAPNRILTILKDAGFNNWKAQSDGSIDMEYCDYGKGLMEIELVSPILRGEKGLIEVFNVMKLLKEKDCKVNSTCGFHVHVGAQTSDIKFFRGLFKIYHDFESVIDSFMNKNRRASNNMYCGELRRNLNAMQRFSDPVRLANNYERYCKLNFASYTKYDTVEFRQHAGTLDGAAAISWIRFCIGMVQKARKGDFMGEMPVALVPMIGLDTIRNMFRLRVMRYTGPDYARRVITKFFVDYKRWVSHNEMCSYLNSASWGTIPTILKRLNIKYEEKRIGRVKYFRIDLREWNYTYDDSPWQNETPSLFVAGNDNILSLSKFLELDAESYAYMTDAAALAA